MITTVTLSPCIDKTIVIDRLKPGSIVRGSSVKLLPSGKGINVSRVLNNLGCETQAYVVCGGYVGRKIVELMQETAIPHRVRTIQDTSRTVVTILEQQTGRSSAFVEPGPELSPLEIEQIKNDVGELAAQSDWMVFSGAVPRPETSFLYKELVELSREKGAKTLLDARDEALTLGLQAHPDFVKPNLTETEKLFGDSLRTCGQISAAVEKLLELVGQRVLLSLGAAGAILAGKNCRLYAKPPLVEAINPVGSGDSMVAGFLAGKVMDEPLEESLRLGVAAGTANAAMWDAACCGWSDINRVLGRVEIHEFKCKANTSQKVEMNYFDLQEKQSYLSNT